jgi:hypothetical protein
MRLPTDMLLEISSFMSIQDLLAVCAVNKELSNMAKNCIQWKLLLDSIRVPTLGEEEEQCSPHVRNFFRQDPRRKKTFKGKTSYKKVSLLIPFVQKCIRNLHSFYNLTDLAHLTTGFDYSWARFSPTEFDDPMFGESYRRLHELETQHFERFKLLLTVISLSFANSEFKYNDCYMYQSAISGIRLEPDTGSWSRTCFLGYLNLDEPPEEGFDVEETRAIGTDAHIREILKDNVPKEDEMRAKLLGCATLASTLDPMSIVADHIDALLLQTKC